MEFAEGVFADRSERAKLRFTGPQAAWFLHQIMTQAFEDIAPGEARDAALITPNGRMVGYMEALATEEAIYCHYEPELRDSFPNAVSRYVLATQVDIADVTDEMGLVLVAGANREELAGHAPAGAHVHPTTGFGTDAAYVWLGRSEVAGLLIALAHAGAREAGETELEAVRIANGIARWGREMDTKTIPLEVGLEDRAIHFDKGCYVGQEAIAKIHLRGHPNRRLVRVTVSATVEAGTELLDGDAVVGTLTSVVGDSGLAVVRYTVGAGIRLRAGETVAIVLD